MAVAALTALAAQTLGLAACGGDDGRGDETSATTTTAEDETATTEDSRDALEAEIVAAYEASWDGFIEAGDPPSPDAPALAEHLAGEALEVTRALLSQYQVEDVVLRRTFEVDAQVTEIGDDRAVVEDCALDQLEVIVPDSGMVVEGHDDERDGFVAELTLEGGSWKVISLIDDDRVCV